MMPQAVSTPGQPATTATNAIKAKKETKPKKDLTQASKLRNGGTAAYWGYKAFQAMRVCTGDVTAVAELATELLAEGVCAGAVANPELVMNAVAAVVDSSGSMKAFRKDINNFALFSGALAKQLNTDGQPQTNGKAMEVSQRLYNAFLECDLDRSGSISLEEYVYFCDRQGVPRSTAEITFFKADCDGDGEISFEEWTAVMAGRVGRDKTSFNCGGHHGLAEFVVVYNGLTCAFCRAPIPAGSRARGCRRCDCDACASCSRLPPVRSAPPSASAAPPPPPRAAASAPPPVPPERRSANSKSTLFDCRLQHGLTLGVRPRGLPINCDWCGSSVPIGHPAVGCRVCDTDGCMNCAATSLTSSPDGNASGLTCHGRHGLGLMQATAGGAQTFRCHFCHGGVAAGAMLFSCRICRVDACVACVWKDHRRALGMGGAFTCSQPTVHHWRTWIIYDQRQLGRRCNWCSGASVLGQPIQRCDACNIDICQACVVTHPVQQAKVARVKAPANAARMAARLASMSITEAAGTGTGPGTGASSRPPPPGYGTAWAPPREAKAAAVPARAPSYDEMMRSQAAAAAVAVASSGTTATATRVPTARGGGKSAPSCPSYNDIAEKKLAATATPGGRENVASAPPGPCSPERETGAAKAVTDPPFCFDSVVRVIGVDDPELDHKLLTVVGFERSGHGTSTRDWVVALHRRGKVFYVSASHVYKVLD